MYQDNFVTHLLFKYLRGGSGRSSCSPSSVHAIIMAISLSSAVFIALFVETLVYGLALAMGIATVAVLSRLNSEGPVPHRQFIAVLSLMLMVATPHIVISFIRAFRAFVLAPAHGSIDPTENVLTEDSLLSAKNILFILQTVLGDSVNIWRFYVIYNKKLRYTIIPSIIMIAGLICGCMTINGPAHTSELFVTTGRWAEAYEALMIATNIYCTAAISWKIYRTAQFHTSGSHARQAFIVIAETGLLYTSSLAINLAFYVTKSSALFIAIDLVLPLVPCIFCFMILQSQMNYSNAPTPPVVSLESVRPSSDSTRPSWLQMRRMLGKDRPPRISSARPVQIQISRREEEHYPDRDVMLVQKRLNDKGSFGDTDEA